MIIKKLSHRYTLLLNLLKMSKSWTSPHHAVNFRQFSLTFFITCSYGIFSCNSTKKILLQRP
jgi:hypothetical protein